MQIKIQEKVWGVLLKRVLEYAVSSNMDYMHVTVSEEKPESLGFFGRKGFQKVDNFNGYGLYKPNIIEFLLFNKISKI